MGSIRGAGEERSGGAMDSIHSWAVKTRDDAEKVINTISYGIDGSCSENGKVETGCSCRAASIGAIDKGRLLYNSAVRWFGDTIAQATSKTTAPHTDDKIISTSGAGAPTGDALMDSAMIVVGSQAVIPDWDWVCVLNDKPMKQRDVKDDGSSELARGGVCAVEFGGHVTVKKVFCKDVLVEYAAPGEPRGTPCPSGAQFIVSKSDFAEMTARYTLKRDAIQAEKEQVKRLLSQNYYGEQMFAGMARAVHAVNLEPVTRLFPDGHDDLVLREFCTVGRSDYGDNDDAGTIRSRGEEDDKVLYEYTAPNNSTGRRCPSGTLFFGPRMSAAEMNGKHKVLLDSIREKKELVKRLLSQNYYGQQVDAGEWHWVDVVNLEPVTRHFANGDRNLLFGDTCGAGRSDHGDDAGTIRARGEEDGKVLYEYTASGAPLGTPCPSGVLFFDNRR